MAWVSTDPLLLLCLRSALTLTLSKMALALKTLEAEAAGGGTRSFLLAFCRAAMCLKEHKAGWSTKGVREEGRVRKVRGNMRRTI